MKRNKILATLLALALLMVTALPMTAFAAGDAALTVNPPSSLVLDAADFKAYKLFDVAVSGAVPDRNYAYTATAATEDFIASTGLVFPFGNNSAAFKAYLESTGPAPDMDLLNAALTAYADAPGFHSDFQKNAVQDVSPNEASVKFTGLDYGYYLIIGEGAVRDKTGAATGEKVAAYSTLYTVEQAAETINLKADAPSIGKEIWNHNVGGTPTDPDDAGWTDWTDLNIGDRADFQLRSRVPVMTGYKAYAFTVHDYMSPGLAFDAESVAVKVGDATLYEGVDYEVNVASPIPNGDPRDNAGLEYEDGAYITIAFDPDRFIALAPGAAIIITYSAELNGAAVIAAPGNPNKAWLRYSNDPYTTEEGNGGDTGETPEDEVRVYTFDLDILKYDGNNENADGFNPADYPLSGAEFTLRRVVNSDSRPPVEAVALEADGPGKYRLAVPGDALEDVITTLVSNANGKIHIKGLDTGVYELEETKAPEGYNPGFITEIAITHEGAGVYSFIIGEAETNRVDIANYSGGLLPGTGGIGIYVIFGAGGLMAILLIAAYVAYRRKRALDILKA